MGYATWVEVYILTDSFAFKKNALEKQGRFFYLTCGQNKCNNFVALF
jgi:hypothetical protein